MSDQKTKKVVEIVVCPVCGAANCPTGFHENTTTGFHENVVENTTTQTTP
jgi:hypothetical protein